MYTDAIKRLERFRLHNQKGDAKMSTFNKTILIGRVAGKAKLTRLKSEDMAAFKMTNNTIQNGCEIVQYHKLRAFGKAAHACAETLEPGMLVCVEGRLHSKEDGTADSIIAEHITLLSKGSSNA